jgi:hypothetical protein
MTGVQRLVRLIALCPLCHGCKHMGRSGIVLPADEFTRLRQHFATVNGIAYGDFHRILDEAGEQWLARDRVSWSQDLSAFLSG